MDGHKVKLPLDMIIPEEPVEKSEKSYDPDNPPLRRLDPSSTNKYARRAKERRIADEFSYPQDFTRINEHMAYTAVLDEAFTQSRRTTEDNILKIKDMIKKNPEKFEECEFRNADSYVKENIADKEKAAETKKLLNLHKIDYYTL